MKRLNLTPHSPSTPPSFPPYFAFVYVSSADQKPGLTIAHTGLVWKRTIVLSFRWFPRTPDFPLRFQTPILVPYPRSSYGICQEAGTSLFPPKSSPSWELTNELWHEGKKGENSRIYPSLSGWIFRYGFIDVLTFKLGNIAESPSHTFTYAVVPLDATMALISRPGLGQKGQTSQILLSDFKVSARLLEIALRAHCFDLAVILICCWTIGCIRKPTASNEIAAYFTSLEETISKQFFFLFLCVKILIQLLVLLCLKMQILQVARSVTNIFKLYRSTVSNKARRRVQQAIKLFSLTMKTLSF